MKRIRLVAILLSILAAGPGLQAEAGNPNTGPRAACNPDPANCEVPDLLTLVARGPDGSADPLGTFTVMVRGYNNEPVENASVILDFRRCTDLRVCSDQLDPNVLVDCISRTVRTLSDAQGRATFRVIGRAINTGACAGSIAPSMEVYTEGIHLETVRVAAFDQNGIAGVNGDDFSLFMADYFSGQPFARSDYDGNGVVDGNDLSRWLAAYFAGGSAQSTGAVCP